MDIKSILAILVTPEEPEHSEPAAILLSTCHVTSFLARCLMPAAPWMARTSQPQRILLWALRLFKMTSMRASAFRTMTVKAARWGCRQKHSSVSGLLLAFALCIFVRSPLALLELTVPPSHAPARQFCDTSEDNGSAFACDPATGIDASRAKVSPPCSFRGAMPTHAPSC